MLGTRNDAQARTEDAMRTLLAARSIGLYLAAFTMVVGSGHAVAETPVPPVDVRVLNR